MTSLAEQLLVPSDIPDEAQAYLRGLYGFEQTVHLDDKLDLERILGYMPLKNDQVVRRFLKHVYKVRKTALCTVTAKIFKINTSAFIFAARIVGSNTESVLEDLFRAFVGTDAHVTSGDDRNCPLEVSESAHHETQHILRETFKVFASFGPLPAIGFKYAGWTCGALLAFATLYSKSGVDADLKEITAFVRGQRKYYYNELLAPIGEYYESHAALYLKYLLQIEHPAVQEHMREQDMLLHLINDDKFECLHAIVSACPARSSVLLEGSEEAFLNRAKEKYEEAREELLHALEESEDESDDEEGQEPSVDKHAHLKERQQLLSAIYVWAGGKKGKRDAEDFLDTDAKVLKGDDEDSDVDANDDDVYEDDEDETDEDDAGAVDEELQLGEFNE